MVGDLVSNELQALIEVSILRQTRPVLAQLHFIEALVIDAATFAES